MRTGWRAFALGLALGLLPGSAQDASLLLKPGPDKHYLVDGNNTPFLIRGEAAWCLPVQLTREDVLAYLADRDEKGFNALLMEVINVADGYASNAPRNAYGQAPFVDDDLRKRNEAYWTHIDFILDEAAKEGVVVFMCPLYLGYNGGSEGWYSVAAAAGIDAVRDYGAFLGARYGNRDNIVWVMGGDFRPPTLAIPDALAAGIRSADTRHLITAHWARNSSGTDGNPAWLTLNSSYGGLETIASRVLADYAATPALPTFLIEGHYEGTIGGQPQLTPQEVRGQAWQAYLSGACGNFYAHHSVWPFGPDWKAALDSPGARSLERLHTYLWPKEWWKLRPDAANTLVTTNKGSGKGYIAAAMMEDRSVALVYSPAGAAFTVDLSKLQGDSITAWWFDPYDGISYRGPNSPYPAVPRTFSRGEPNADPSVAKDWLLVLIGRGSTGIKPVERILEIRNPSDQDWVAADGRTLKGPRRGGRQAEIVTFPRK